MTYVVHYTIKHKDKSQDFEEACFSSVGYQLAKLEPVPTKDTKLIYEYIKANKNNNDEINRNYLNFLKHIPEFSPYIDTDNILSSGIWEFPLNAPRIHFCVLASLIRAMVEEQNIVKLCAFIEAQNLYNYIKNKHNLNNIGILQVCGTIANNIGHWVSNHAYLVPNELRQDLWEIKDTIVNQYFGGVHSTFNGVTGFGHQSNATLAQPVFDALISDLKETFKYK